MCLPNIEAHDVPVGLSELTSSVNGIAAITAHLTISVTYADCGSDLASSPESQEERLLGCACRAIRQKSPKQVKAATLPVLIRLSQQPGAQLREPGSKIDKLGEVV